MTYTVDKTSTFDTWRVKYNQLAVDALTVNTILMTGQLTDGAHTIYSYALTGDPGVTPNTGFEADIAALGGMGNGSVDLQTVRDSFSSDHPVSTLINVPGAVGDRSFIAGGKNNTTANIDSAVIGGELNVSYGNRSVIIGGLQNFTNAGANSSIFAGQQNETRGDNSAIVAGQFNFLNGTADRSAIIAGSNNTSSSVASTILGGSNNTIAGSSSGIIGGLLNEITASAGNSVIAGGTSNTVTSSATDSVILGGANNTINAAAGYSVILGGQLNQITGSNSVVGGNSSKAAFTSFAFGEGAEANATESIALGRGRVDHVGSMVLAGNTRPTANLSTQANELRTFFNNGVHFDYAGSPNSNIASVVYEGGTRSTLTLHSNDGQIRMRSPDGTEYRVTVANGGTLTVTAV